MKVKIYATDPEPTKLESLEAGDWFKTTVDGDSLFYVITESKPGNAARVLEFNSLSGKMFTFFAMRDMDVIPVREPKSIEVTL